MERVLQAQGDTHFDFLALAAAETDPDTRAGLLQSFERLLLKYPDNGQLLFGKALLLQPGRPPEEALQLLEAHNASAARKCHSLLLHARLLQGLQRGDEALKPPAARRHGQHPDRQAPAPGLRPPAGRAGSAWTKPAPSSPHWCSNVPRGRRPAPVAGPDLPGEP